MTTSRPASRESGVIRTSSGGRRWATRTTYTDGSVVVTFTSYGTSRGASSTVQGRVASEKQAATFTPRDQSEGLY